MHACFTALNKSKESESTGKFFWCYYPQTKFYKAVLNFFFIFSKHSVYMCLYTCYPITCIISCLTFNSKITT